MNPNHKHLRLLTHENNGSAPEREIPKGMALMYETDSGWVGTNNGQPFVGQPALFPESQARGIANAVNIVRHLGRERIEQAMGFPLSDEQAANLSYLFGPEASR